MSDQLYKMYCPGCDVECDIASDESSVHGRWYRIRHKLDSGFYKSALCDDLGMSRHEKSLEIFKLKALEKMKRIEYIDLIEKFHSNQIHAF